MSTRDVLSLSSSSPVTAASAAVGKKVADYFHSLTGAKVTFRKDIPTKFCPYPVKSWIGLTYEDGGKLEGTDADIAALSKLLKAQPTVTKAVKIAGDTMHRAFWVLPDKGVVSIIPGRNALFIGQAK